MKVYLAMVAVLATVFTVELAWVFAADPANAWPGVKALLSDPWGMLTAFDLVLGIVLFSGVIYANEASKSRALLWIACLCCLGNPVSAVYVLFHYRTLWARLNGEHSEHSAVRATA